MTGCRPGLVVLPPLQTPDTECRKSVFYRATNHGKGNSRKGSQDHEALVAGHAFHAPVLCASSMPTRCRLNPGPVRERWRIRDKMLRGTSPHHVRPAPLRHRWAWSPGRSITWHHGTASAQRPPVTTTPSHATTLVARCARPWADGDVGRRDTGRNPPPRTTPPPPMPKMRLGWYAGVRFPPAAPTARQSFRQRRLVNVQSGLDGPGRRRHHIRLPSASQLLLGHGAPGAEQPLCAGM